MPLPARLTLIVYGEEATIIPMSKHPRVDSSIHDAYEILGGFLDTKLFLTAEHAEERVPEGFHFRPEDERLRGTHWAYDLGVSELTRELSEALEAPGVLARFTRLLVDPNRAEDEDELFRTEAEGAPVLTNVDLSEAERERRLTGLYRPYHEAIDTLLERSTAPIVFSVHSFTPVYEGKPREMELGVLFNREVELAERLRHHLEEAGFIVAMNEPYSGALGLIYSAESHADRHGKHALELEIRQDLAVDPRARAKVVAGIESFIAELP